MGLEPWWALSLGAAFYAIVVGSYTFGGVGGRIDKHTHRTASPTAVTGVPPTERVYRGSCLGQTSCIWQWRAHPTVLYQCRREYVRFPIVKS